MRVLAMRRARQNAGTNAGYGNTLAKLSDVGVSVSEEQMGGGGGASSFSSPSIRSMSLQRIISLAFVDDISRAIVMFFNRVSVGSELPHWWYRFNLSNS